MRNLELSRTKERIRGATVSAAAALATVATADDVNGNYLLIAARLGLLVVGSWQLVLLVFCCNCCRRVWSRPGCHKLRLPARISQIASYQLKLAERRFQLLSFDIFSAISENLAHPTESYISSRWQLNCYVSTGRGLISACVSSMDDTANWWIGGGNTGIGRLAT